MAAPKAIEYEKVIVWELKAECRKNNLDSNGGWKELKALLKAHYEKFPSTHPPMPLRIGMEIGNDTDYNDFFFYQLEFECRSRKLRIYPQDHKFNLVKCLIADDQKLLLVKLQDLSTRSDQEMTMWSNFEADITAFEIRQADVRFKSQMEDLEVYYRIETKDRKTKIETDSALRVKTARFKFARASKRKLATLETSASSEKSDTTPSAQGFQKSKRRGDDLANGNFKKTHLDQETHMGEGLAKARDGHLSPSESNPRGKPASKTGDPESPVTLSPLPPAAKKSQDLNGSSKSISEASQPQKPVSSSLAKAGNLEADVDQAPQLVMSDSVLFQLEKVEWKPPDAIRADKDGYWFSFPQTNEGRTRSGKCARLGLWKKVLWGKEITPSWKNNSEMAMMGDEQKRARGYIDENGWGTGNPEYYMTAEQRLAYNASTPSDDEDKADPNMFVDHAFNARQSEKIWRASQANRRPTNSKYSGNKRPYKNLNVAMNVPPATIVEEVFDTPHVILTRPAKSQESSLIRLFEKIASPHKRCIMADDRGKVYISFQNTLEGEVDAESLGASEPQLENNWGFRDFLLEYRPSSRKSWGAGSRASTTRDVHS